jgi:hypothetical protein
MMQGTPQKPYPGVPRALRHVPFALNARRASGLEDSLARLQVAERSETTQLVLAELWSGASDVWPQKFGIACREGTPEFAGHVGPLLAHIPELTGVIREIEEHCASSRVVLDHLVSFARQGRQPH